MARDSLLSKLVLLPMSRLYGMGVWIRNQMFERKLLKSVTPEVPVVVVGNIAAGGTGKTPHAEYILSTLRDRYHVGLLSRGYRRTTKGFVQGGSHSTPADIGDEPYQILHKFGGDVSVAVCEKRAEGIERMREIDPDIDLFVLDDAFQHRYVTPTVAIVLTEYSRPVFSDKLLPYGRLREPVTALNRADIVVVTKCPETMKPMDVRMFKEKLNLFPFQKLFFSRFVYGHLMPVFPDKVSYVPYLDWLTEDDTLLIVSGIANPRPFVRHIRRYRARVNIIRFPDHCAYAATDMAAIQKKFDRMSGKRKYIITTEKDAVKLAFNPYFPHKLKSSAFYLPVSVEFTGDASPETFDTTLEKMIKTKTTPLIPKTNTNLR